MRTETPVAVKLQDYTPYPFTLDAVDLLTQLDAVLRQQPGIPVYVKGDRRVPYGKVVELMALIQGAGVPSVGLMT